MGTAYFTSYAITDRAFLFQFAENAFLAAHNQQSSAVYLAAISSLMIMSNTLTQKLLELEDYVAFGERFNQALQFNQTITVFGHPPQLPHAKTPIDADVLMDSAQATAQIAEVLINRVKRGTVLPPCYQQALTGLFNHVNDVLYSHLENIYKQTRSKVKVHDKLSPDLILIAMVVLRTKLLSR